jgi:acyl-CoA reductase-like NAD-dependent aldehyde dehydrogenase
MIEPKNLAGKSGYPFAFAVTAIAICAALVMGAPAVLAPAAATSDVSTTANYAGPSGYFPDEYVNQAKEIEPMPEMYY